MAYSELIKNFERIRDYMRQFYVYGFKHRTEYDRKSARSYDNERRRIESWLGDSMFFRQDPEGKRVFLSVDSRAVEANPLYQAFKARSFTDGDITFHFYILDLLANGSALSVGQIMDALTERYYAWFETAEELDESSVRKKLREYVALGLLKAEKCGREWKYSCAEETVDLGSWKESVAFFSEVDPVGVIGSYILDKFESKSDLFRIKHHYMLHALDSQVLYEILEGIRQDRQLHIQVRNRRTDEGCWHTVFPLKIYVSTQNGRRHLMAVQKGDGQMMLFRLDTILQVKLGEVEKEPQRYQQRYEEVSAHLWGTTLGSIETLDRVRLEIHVEDDEGYIVDRLLREKRCGTVHKKNDHTYVYLAEVYNASEMLPWIRTFIGRIRRFNCSNKYVVRRFYEDLKKMDRLYGGDDHAVS